MATDKWFDGGYKAGQQVTVDGVRYRLTVSLGTLGWVAYNYKTRRKEVLMFTSEESHA